MRASEFYDRYVANFDELQSKIKNLHSQQEYELANLWANVHGVHIGDLVVVARVHFQPRVRKVESFQLPFITDCGLELPSMNIGNRVNHFVDLGTSFHTFTSGGSQLCQYREELQPYDSGNGCSVCKARANNSAFDAIVAEEFNKLKAV